MKQFVWKYYWWLNRHHDKISGIKLNVSPRSAVDSPLLWPGLLHDHGGQQTGVDSVQLPFLPSPRSRPGDHHPKNTWPSWLPQMVAIIVILSLAKFFKVVSFPDLGRDTLRKIWPLPLMWVFHCSCDSGATYLWALIWELIWEIANMSASIGAHIIGQQI